MKPLVYVAGPISSNPMHGTHAAVKAADVLLDSGLVLPFVPHLTVPWDTVSPRHYDAWMAYDFGVIDHCAALLRLPGDSPGADREVVYAESQGRPVFRDIPILLGWAKDVAEGRVAA